MKAPHRPPKRLAKKASLRDRLAPPSPRLKWPLFFAALLLTGLGWSALASLLQTQSIRHTFAALITPQFWLTALLFFALAAFFALLTRTLWVGGLLSYLPFLLFGLVNYFKLSITGNPFSLGDLALTGNVGNIVALNAKSMTPGRSTVLTVVLFLLWLGVLIFFSKPLRLPRWRTSLPAALAPLAVLAGVFWFGSDPLIFEGFQVPTRLGVMSQAILNDRCGFPLGLLRAAKYMAQPPVIWGEEYLLSAIQGAEVELGETGEDGPVHPNIILVLSESFFDVTTLPGVTCSADPIPEFRALQAEGVSGAFHSRTLGYGTCDIELEILTGINTHLMGNENLYAMSAEMLQSLPSVPMLLKDRGYRSVMLHTFDDSIYHRDQLMEAVGFDERYFSGDFAQIDPKAAEADAVGNYGGYMGQKLSGGFYSDSYMADLIIDLYEGNDSGQPLFTYAITMEGHTPYDSTKYSPEELTVDIASPLTGEAATALTMYAQSTASASAALGKLTDYFREVEEPTVILFFGDHRPGLGLEGSTTESVYSHLYGSTVGWEGGTALSEIVDLRTTTYLIWANDPDLLPAPAGTERDTSTNYFGLSILEAAQVAKPLYWRVLEQLSETRLIDTVEYSLDRQGNPSYTVPQEGADHERLRRLNSFLRDALYQDQVVTDRLFK